MKSCLLFFILLPLLFIVSPAQGKTLYLSDGSWLEYAKAWKQQGRIYVLVNRDTLVDFALGEVNQRKTLKSAKLKRFPVRKASAKPTAPAPGVKKAPLAKPVDPGNEPDKPLVFDDFRSPVAGRWNGSEVTPELVSVYENLHNAMKSKKLDQVKRYLASQNVASMGKQEMAMSEAGVSLMPPNRTILGSDLSEDGSSAILRMEARTNKNDAKPAASGTVSYVWEQGAWKVDKEHWDMNMN